MKRIAIIGAGPIGLETAVAALDRNYAVDLFERRVIADHILQWGHVRMFSPFEMNATKRGISRLHLAGVKLHKPDELLTGAEFRERYLIPLAQSLPAGVVHENTEVLAIGRRRALKGDHIGQPARNQTPFRLLVREEKGERMIEADLVFDCSGTYSQPNGLGDGGIPVPGEAAAHSRIFYGIPDFADAEDERFAGRRVLVVGAGHSGATAVNALAQLPAQEVHWLLRRDRNSPVEEVEDDPLPERAQLASRANRLARDGSVQVHRQASVMQIQSPNESLEVTIEHGAGTKTLSIDQIIVATGFRPDLSLTRELQVQTCWATEGTYPLAAALLGEAGADCLTTPAFGAEMLKHPEPGFFTLGMKSYGRSPNFLLRTGHEQIESVLDYLEAQRAA